MEFGFHAREVDKVKLYEWLNDDLLHRPLSLLSAFANCGTDQIDRALKKAIQLTGNSSPGPDGICFAAWRALGPLGRITLRDALLEMAGDEGLQLISTDYCTFNESLLFILPKKAVDQTDDGTPIYDADSIRPLNATNADNRILANTVRIILEPAVALHISHMQRGFLSGRSMLANVVGLDTEMANMALSKTDPGAVLFDFRAAFPSVEHWLIFAILAMLGIPGWILQFIKILYTNNFCYIAFNGSRYKGFVLSRGVRQGCPLSPLLFAIISDVLLRRLSRLIPEASIFAYADDLAMALPNFIGRLKMLELFFDTWHSISGLALNIAKTFIIPLFAFSEDDLRSRISAMAPSWGAIAIKLTAKYLGFYVGPERGNLSWLAPLQKFRERCLIWRNIGPGMLHSIKAFKVYIFPVLAFVLQLECLPADFDASFAKGISALFPGPRGWITPGCLSHLKSLHFPD